MKRDPLSAPKGMIWRDNQLVVRRQGYVPSDVPLHCRRGHTIHGESIVHEGSISLNCKHQLSDGSRCNEMVFVMFGYPGQYYRADITRDEAHEMRRLGWNTDRILDYVGAKYEPPQQEAV